MAFQKGKKKTGGRKKNVPNKVTVDLRELITGLLTDQFNQVTEDLRELNPKDRVAAWIKLLEYSLPKLQRNDEVIDFSKLDEDQAEAVLNRLAVKLKEEL